MHTVPLELSIADTSGARTAPSRKALPCSGRIEGWYCSGSFELLNIGFQAVAARCVEDDTVVFALPKALYAAYSIAPVCGAPLKKANSLFARPVQAMMENLSQVCT